MWPPIGYYEQIFMGRVHSTRGRIAEIVLGCSGHYIDPPNGCRINKINAKFQKRLPIRAQ